MANNTSKPESLWFCDMTAVMILKMRNQVIFAQMKILD